MTDTREALLARYEAAQRELEAAERDKGIALGRFVNIRFGDAGDEELVAAAQDVQNIQEKIDSIRNETGKIGRKLAGRKVERRTLAMRLLEIHLNHPIEKVLMAGSLREVGRTLGVSKSTVSKWRLRLGLREGQPASLEPVGSRSERKEDPMEASLIEGILSRIEGDQLTGC